MTRLGWAFALLLAFVATTGCHSARTGRPVAMMPAAPIDNTPRTKAVGPPRGADPSASLSTAALVPLKKATGEEESVYEFPIPKAPTESVVVPKTNIAPPPPPEPAPSPLPNTPIAPPPGALPPADSPLPKQTSNNSSPAPGVTITGLVPVDDFPPSDKIIVIGAEEPKGVRVRSTGVAGIPTQTEAKKTAIDARADEGMEHLKQKLIARMYQEQPPALDPPPQVPPPVAAPKLPDFTPPPSPSASAGDDLAKLRALYEKAKVTEAGMSSYTLRLRQREAMGGKLRPEEVLVAKFRREPFSVYLKWIGAEHKNREVCYVKGQHEDKIHTLLAPGDHFLFAGKAMAFPLDSPLVKSNSRYPVTDGGLAALIGRFGKLVSALEAGDTREGTAKCLGKVKRPEFDAAVEGVEMTLPTSPLFPKGGRRLIYFDAENGLPVLIISYDDQNREVEYYCHERIQSPVNLDDDDFNPSKLWKK